MSGWGNEYAHSSHEVDESEVFEIRMLSLSVVFELTKQVLVIPLLAFCSAIAFLPLTFSKLRQMMTERAANQQWFWSD